MATNSALRQSQLQGEDERQHIDAFIKFMAATIWAHNHAKEVVALVRSKLPEWQGKAQPFLLRYKIPPTLFDKIMKQLTNTTKDYALWDKSLASIGDNLRQQWPKIQANTDISFEQLALLRAIGTYCRTKSEPSFRSIVNSVSKLNEMALRAMFFGGTITFTNPAKLVKRLEELTTKLIGKSAARLSREEAAKAKQVSPKLYEEYQKIRKELNEISKTVLRNIVDGSGKLFLPFDDVVKKMQSRGVPTDILPEGFVGHIGGDGSLYTIEGLKIQNKASGLKVQMNPNYDAKADKGYVFAILPQPGIGTTARIFTENHVSRASQKKFELVQDITKNLDSIKTRWRGDLLQQKGLKGVLGLMVELLYRTAARIGSLGNMNDGLSTWRVKNIKLQTSKLVIKYIGKKGVPQEHIVSGSDNVTRIVFDMLTRLMHRKKPDDLVFTDNGKHVDSRQVNQYLKSIGFNAGAHKFRHVHGTALMNDLIQKKKYVAKGKNAQNDAEAWFKREILENVANLLGHKKASGEPMWQTSSKSYCDPHVQAQWFLTHGLRVPKWLRVTTE